MSIEIPLALVGLWFSRKCRSKITENVWLKHHWPKFRHVKYKFPLNEVRAWTLETN